MTVIQSYTPASVPRFDGKTVYKHFGNGVLESIHGCFKKFGQELPLDDRAALDMLLAGGAILTVDEWNAIGFTVEEKSNRHTRVGPAYMSRHGEAMRRRLALVDDLKKRLEGRAANG